MPWSDVRDTITLGNRAPQTDTTGFMEEEVVALDRTAMSEDCLRLNIWTAGLGDGRKRPVMLWCHGGGFTGGSGGNVRYDGTMLAKKHDVVLVTVNHRLNAFGFLYLAKLGGEKYADSGNVGMLDIVAALELGERQYRRIRRRSRQRHHLRPVGRRQQSHHRHGDAAGGGPLLSRHRRKRRGAEGDHAGGGD